MGNYRDYHFRVREEQATEKLLQILDMTINMLNVERE